jgi:Leucine-rich repeat (LRR) protein
MKFFLVVAAILLCAFKSSALVLECFFDQELLFDDLKVSYTCSVKNLTTNSTFRSVSNIHGDHVERNTDDDVTQLYIIHENMEYFPIGFTKFFKNLVAVHAGMNKMKFLEKDDLRDFDNLRFLYLYNNKLEVLQSDVFEHTKSLEYVSLHSNHLKYIGAKILLPLKHLRNAYFNRNICIHAATSPTKI